MQVFDTILVCFASVRLCLAVAVSGLVTIVAAFLNGCLTTLIEPSYCASTLSIIWPLFSVTVREKVALLRINQHRTVAVIMIDQLRLFLTISRVNRLGPIHAPIQFLNFAC